MTAGAELAAVYDVDEATPPELVDVLLELGYTVDAFEHGLHVAGDPPHVGYRVTGFGVDRIVGDAGLAELVADHADRVAELELADVHETVEQSVRQLLETRVELLEAASRQWPQLTVAQKDSANRLAVRGVALLARLELRRLDTAGD